MKRILALALILLITLGLFGCAKAPEDIVTDDSDGPSTEQTEPEPEPITVAVCMGSINHPVHRIVQTGFMLKAEELGMNGVISGLDEGSIAQSIKKWQSAVANGATGVLIWTGDDSCYEMMKEFKEKGVYTVVPHFIHDYEYTKDFIDKNMSCLAHTYGRNVADYITNELIARGITSGSIGISANSPSVLITPGADGFRQRMDELNTQYEVLELILEGNDISNATQKIVTYINANPDIVAGFGTTGASCQIWNDAMELTGHTELIVVGIDYTELNIELVSNGQITAIVCQPLFEEGGACAQALYDLNNGVVFNTSEDTWFEELEAPIADIDDMPYYRDIWQKMYDYFGEE